MNILVILSPGFEETEAITVIDILRRAKLDVITASLADNAAVMGSHQIVVMADTTLSECEGREFDVIVLPGGMRGVENMLSSSKLLHAVRHVSDRGGILAAVCAAPLVLDSLGLLVPGHFTCHPCVYERLSSPIPSGSLTPPSVTHLNVVTGRSAGCAMAWSLALVERLLGEVPESVLNGLVCP